MRYRQRPLSIGLKRSHHSVLVAALFLIPSGCAVADGSDTSVSARDEPIVAETSARASLPAAGHAWVIFGSDTITAEVAATALEAASRHGFGEELQILRAEPEA